MCMASSWAIGARLPVGGRDFLYTSPNPQLHIVSTPLIRIKFVYVTINIKVYSRRKICSSSEVDKVGIVTFTFCRCVITELTSTTGLQQWEQNSSHAVGTLNWILNKPSLWKDMYMTLMLTCLNLVSLGAVCCTGTTLKLFWFTDSVVELTDLFLLGVMACIMRERLPEVQWDSRVICERKKFNSVTKFW
jgi:hypothetical protein